MDAQGVREIIKEYLSEHPFATQQDIANRSGMSKGYISMFLNGVNNTTGAPIYEIKTDTARALADAIGMTFEELVSKADGKKAFRKIPILHGIKYDSNLEALISTADKYEMVSSKIIQGYAAIAYNIKENNMSPEIVANDTAIVVLNSFTSGSMFLIAPRELHPVKRTMKNNKIFLGWQLRLPAAFYAARYRSCFSIGVRTPRLRCTRRVL